MDQKEAIRLMKELGAARRNERHNYITASERHTHTDYGAKLLSKLKGDIISSMYEDIKYTYAWVEPMKDLGVEFCVDTVIRCCIDRMFSDMKYAGLVMRCTEALEDAVKVSFIEKYVKYGKNKLTTIKYGRRKKDILRHIIANGTRKKKIAFVTYERSLFQYLSHAILVRLFLHEFCPIQQTMRVVQRGNRRLNIRYVTLRDGVAKWVRECRDQDILLKPFWLPMVEKPIDWIEVYIGGYPNSVRQVDFVANNNREWVYSQDWESFKPSGDAANYIQSVPHIVNRSVYDAAKDLYDNRVQFEGFPAWELTPVPQVDREHYTETTAREIRDIKVFNDKTRRSKGKLAVCMKMHEEFLDNDIYIPVKSDYRGRLYTIPFDITYQGTDLHKSLLSFKDGSQCAKQGTEDWLIRQLANSYGWDKKPIHERITIVDKKRDLIARVGSDPENTFREWGKVSDPWQFMAACIEWESYRKDKDNHVHTLPIGMDASCNGLQILSIMAGSEEGCIATNVLPSDTPKDFYNIVLKKTIERLKGMNDSFSKRWVEFEITRKTVKQPTMTLPYGGTTYSVIEHVATWLEEETLKRQTIFELHERNKACAHLAKEITAAIYECLPNVKWLMDWFKDVARTCVEQGISPEWKSPSGFKIRQTYQKGRSMKIRTGIVVSLNHDTDELNSMKHINGIVPNFIHGVDSSILHELTKKLRVHPVLSQAPLSSVHDCYNTTAPYADDMCGLVRETFCEVMSRDLLQEFMDYLEGIGVKDLPLLPNRNKISLSDMRDSLYLFS